MPRVFIPNLSHHDYSDARRFGELVFLTEGWVDISKVNSIYRRCWEKMQDCEPEDFILVSGLSIINSAAASIMAMRHRRVNYLVFQRGSYVPTSVVVDPSSMVDQNLINPAG